MIHIASMLTAKPITTISENQQHIIYSTYNNQCTALFLAIHPPSPNIEKPREGLGTRLINVDCTVQIRLSRHIWPQHMVFYETKNHGTFVQSTLRRPEVRMFAWKIGIYMAHMGVNNMRGTRATTNKIGSKFNTVTLDRSYFTVYLSDL